MADETNPLIEGATPGLQEQPPAEPAPEPQPSAATGRTFSQDDVNRIVAERLAQERRSRQKQQPAPEPEPPAKEPAAKSSNGGVEELRSELDQLRWDLAFERAFASTKVDPAYRRMAELHVKDTEPTDMAQAIRDLVSGLPGATASTQPLAPRNGTLPAPTAPVQSQAADGSARKIPAAEAELDIWALDSEDQIRAIGMDRIMERFTQIKDRSQSVKGVPFRTKIPGK